MRLEAKNLGFRYTNGPWILKNVNFSIEEGERVGLVGPSGYGKSTLVKLLGGWMESLWRRKESVRSSSFTNTRRRLSIRDGR